MPVILAEKAGFCFGVDRAIKLIEGLVEEGRSVATLGPIIHNQQVIDSLAQKGVKVVESPSQVEKGTVLVLRTHGVTRDVLQSVEACGCEYIDAVCPFVKNVSNKFCNIEHIVQLTAAGKTVKVNIDASNNSYHREFICDKNNILHNED